MIKSLLFLVIPLLMSNDSDIRQLKWGMTMAEVKKAETLKLELDLGSKLKYTAQLGGQNYELLYEFKESKLYKATYTSKENYPDKNGYITDFKNLKKLLSQKYGMPVSDEEKWTNEKYKSNTADHGKAVSEGHIKYSSSWKTDRSSIVVSLSGMNFKCFLVLNYEALNTKWNNDNKPSKDDL